MKSLSQISSPLSSKTVLALQVPCSKFSSPFSLRAIFSVLDLMKVDMANFAVASIRPHLMQQSVDYERKKFQQLLEKQPSTSNASCALLLSVFSIPVL